FLRRQAAGVRLRNPGRQRQGAESAGRVPTRSLRLLRLCPGRPTPGRLCPGRGREGREGVGLGRRQADREGDVESLQRGTNRPEADFTAGGKTLVTWTEKGIRIWDLGGAEPVEKATFKGDRWPALSPDGRTLAVEGKEGIQFWDLSGPAPRESGTIKAA